MALEGLVVGVDLDGVCADFYGTIRRVAAEWLECDEDELTRDVGYSLAEWGIQSKEQYESLHRFAVTQRGLFQNVPMIRGARKYLRKLSDEKVRIRIITHRLFIHYFHQTAVNQTIQWLDYHGIPYWDLCFMKAKHQVGADLYIEDAPHNVKMLREAGYHTICFANSTNEGVEPPRLKTWREIYEYIHGHYGKD